MDETWSNGKNFGVEGRRRAELPALWESRVLSGLKFSHL